MMPNIHPMKVFFYKTAAWAKENYPFLIIVGLVLTIFLPYLSGRYMVMGPAGDRSQQWIFLLGDHLGWINFFRNMGEFTGGDYHYGYFSPIHILFRLLLNNFNTA